MEHHVHRQPLRHQSVRVAARDATSTEPAEWQKEGRADGDGSLGAGSFAHVNPTMRGPMQARDPLAKLWTNAVATRRHQGSKCCRASLRGRGVQVMGVDQGG